MIGKNNFKNPRIKRTIKEQKNIIQIILYDQGFIGR